MVKSPIKIALLATAVVSTFSLTGCSTVSSGVDSVGQSMVSAGEFMQQKTADVEVQKTAESQFYLAQYFEQAVTDLDSWAMRIEAREVCPSGYVYLSRHARKLNSGFAYSDAQCYGEMNCGYKLEWQIECADVPDEPFSFFGKS